MSNTYNPKILSLDEIDTLIKTCYYREMAAIKSASYEESIDQANDMRACNAALAAAEELLNQERNDQAYSDSQKEEVRQTIWEFVRGGLRNAIENFRNMTLRKEYILNIRNSVRHFIQQLDNDMMLIAILAEHAADARNFVLEQTRAKLSKTARAFSQWLKEEGLTFNNLVIRYTEKLRIAGTIPNQPFAQLAMEDQNRVYIEIINASGRSNNLINKISKAMGILGEAMILLTLGTIVWDIVESSNPTLTAVKNAFALGAGFVGAEIGAGIGVIIGEVGGPPGIFIGGVLGAIIGGFAAGKAADSIFDALVLAFSNPIPSELIDYSLWGNPIIYTPLLPDGSELSGSLFPSEPL